MSTSNMNTRAGRARLLTMDEAAAALGVGNRMIRRLVADRRIPSVRVGRHVRFRESDIDTFIHDSLVPAVRSGRGGV